MSQNSGPLVSGFACIFRLVCGMNSESFQANCQIFERKEKMYVKTKFLTRCNNYIYFSFRELIRDNQRYARKKKKKRKVNDKNNKNKQNYKS